MVKYIPDNSVSLIKLESASLTLNPSDKRSKLAFYSHQDNLPFLMDTPPKE